MGCNLCENAWSAAKLYKNTVLAMHTIYDKIDDFAYVYRQKWFFQAILRGMW